MKIPTKFNFFTHKKSRSKKKYHSFNLNRLITTFILIFICTILGYFSTKTSQDIKVLDGDTITVTDTVTNKKVAIRFYGIDCPEKNQPDGEEAAKFLKSKIEGNKIKWESKDKDRYDREVAFVFLETGELLNEELVKYGHAWVYTAYCKLPICSVWKQMENNAQKQKIGLWTDSYTKEPIPPWKWRKDKK